MMCHSVAPVASGPIPFLDPHSLHLQLLKKSGQREYPAIGQKLPVGSKRVSRGLQGFTPNRHVPRPVRCDLTSSIYRIEYFSVWEKALVLPPQQGEVRWLGIEEIGHRTVAPGFDTVADGAIGSKLLLACLFHVALRDLRYSQGERRRKARK